MYGCGGEVLLVFDLEFLLGVGGEGGVYGWFVVVGGYCM